MHTIVKISIATMSKTVLNVTFDSFLLLFISTYLIDESIPTQIMMFHN